METAIPRIVGSIFTILGLIAVINPRPLRSMIWTLQSLYGWKPDKNHPFQSQGFFRLIGILWLTMGVIVLLALGKLSG